MKLLNGGWRFGLLTLGLLALPGIHAPALRAQAEQAAPTLIPVSGTLQTDDGQPRTGTVLLRIALYENESDPTPMWIEHQTVTLGPTGSYEVLAGATFSGGLPTYLFGSPVRFVGVAIENEAEQPRVRLTGVPYAARAATADSLGGRAASDFVLTENLRTDITAALQTPELKAALASEGDEVGILGTPGCLAKFDASGNPSNTVDSRICEAGTTITVDANARIGSAAAGAVLVRSAGVNSAVLRPAVSNGSLLISDDSELATRGITIANGGLVGIGTASPAARFHVNGTARVSGQLTAESKVGVGTTDPGAMLDVNGSARLGSSSLGAVLVKTAGASAALIRPAVNNGSLLISDDSELVARGLTIANGGFVGIGTDSPRAKLEIAGGAYITGNVTVDGNIGAKYQDVAEWVESPEALANGTVVRIDAAAPNRVVAAAHAYDARVAGAISERPGIVLGERGQGKVLVAQSGRVRIKVDARYGAVRIGDLLVSSATPGHAMRASPRKVRPGTVLGKALEALPSGRGEILALLTLQ